MLKKKLLRTWDRFLVPLPLGRGLFIYGDPILVSRDTNSRGEEVIRRHLEEELNRLTEEADAVVTAG